MLSNRVNDSRSFVLLYSCSNDRYFYFHWGNIASLCLINKNKLCIIYVHYLKKTMHWDLKHQDWSWAMQRAILRFSIIVKIKNSDIRNQNRHRSSNHSNRRPLCCSVLGRTNQTQCSHLACTSLNWKTVDYVYVALTMRRSSTCFWVIQARPWQVGPGVRQRRKARRK